MKKIFLLVLTLSLLIGVGTNPISAGEGKGHGWYVKRNKDHYQPEADPSFLEIQPYGAFYVDKAHGDKMRDKVLYLTFDAGYENGNVSKIVDVLETEEIPAAFFVLPHFIKANPELCQRILQNGGLLCNHSVHHRDMSVMTAEEIREELSGVEEVCQEVLGRPLAKFFRPPEGRYSVKTVKTAFDCGYRTVLWSFAYADWDNGKQPDPAAAKKKILDNMHNGAIILLHPTSETNAEILKDVICALKEEGYRFASLEELG